MKLKKNYTAKCPECGTINKTDENGGIIEGCRCGRALDVLEE